MKYALAFLSIFLSPITFAQDVDSEINAKIVAISELFSDGEALLIQESIQVKDIIEPATGNCVTLVSFYMEGFSGGNNSSQFISFFSCVSKTGDFDPGRTYTKNILGVHPFYHHRNKYDINSAMYKGRVITINSPAGTISFTNEHSIWWAQSAQLGI